MSDAEQRRDAAGMIARHLVQMENIPANVAARFAVAVTGRMRSHPTMPPDPPAFPRFRLFSWWRQ